MYPFYVSRYVHYERLYVLWKKLIFSLLRKSPAASVFPIFGWPIQRFWWLSQEAWHGTFPHRPMQALIFSAGP